MANRPLGRLKLRRVDPDEPLGHAASPLWHADVS